MVLRSLLVPRIHKLRRRLTALESSLRRGGDVGPRRVALAPVGVDRLALVPGQLARLLALDVDVAAGCLGGAQGAEVEEADGEEPGAERAHDDGEDDDDPAEGADGAGAGLADEGGDGEVDDGAPEDDLGAVDDGVGLEGAPALEALDVLCQELVGDEDERLGTLCGLRAVLVIFHFFFSFLYLLVA